MIHVHDGCLGHLSSTPTVHAFPVQSVLTGLFRGNTQHMSASSHHRNDRLRSRLSAVPNRIRSAGLAGPSAKMPIVRAVVVTRSIARRSMLEPCRRTVL
jgi:hypothetical protein